MAEMAQGAEAASRRPPGRSGGSRKRAGRLQSGGVIREAATALFLRSGYLGTSMDEVAALAGVSKQTVYTHFSDKEALFAALVDRSTAHAEAFLETLAVGPEEGGDVAGGLPAPGRRYIASVVQP